MTTNEKLEILKKLQEREESLAWTQEAAGTTSHWMSRIIPSIRKELEELQVFVNTGDYEGYVDWSKGKMHEALQINLEHAEKVAARKAAGETQEARAYFARIRAWANGKLAAK